MKKLRINEIAKNSNTPTHLLLRDQLIKIYIEDQGKERMDNKSITKLTAMCFGQFIESLPDIYQGYKASKRHRFELEQIIKNQGLPTEKMIGTDYAMQAIFLILFQSPKEYMAKYRPAFEKQFGIEKLKIYDNMQK